MAAFSRHRGRPPRSCGKFAVCRGAADLGGHHRGQGRQRRLVGGPKRVVHQPEHDGIGSVDDVVPERQRVTLPLDGVGLGLQVADGLVEQ